jgi:hypothetical protein
MLCPCRGLLPWSTRETPSPPPLPTIKGSPASCLARRRRSSEPPLSAGEGRTVSPTFRPSSPPTNPAHTSTRTAWSFPDRVWSRPGCLLAGAKLPAAAMVCTAELTRRSTSRRLQPLKSTLGESLIIPGHFPGQSRPSLGRIPAIPVAGRAQGPNCRRCFPSKGLTVKIRDLFAKNQFQI